MPKSVGLFHIPEDYGSKFNLINDIVRRTPVGTAKLDMLYMSALLTNAIAHPEHWIPESRMVKSVQPCVVCESEYYMPEAFYNQGYCSKACKDQ